MTKKYKIFNKLGLKSSINSSQYQSRLDQNPDFFEFYLTFDDVINHPNNIQKAIDIVKEKVNPEKIILHHPSSTPLGKNNSTYNPNKNKKEQKQYNFFMITSEILANLTIKNNVFMLLHGGYSLNKRSDKPDYDSIYKKPYDKEHRYIDIIKSRINYFKNISANHLMLENSISTLFSFGKLEFDNEVKFLGVPLVYDISHAFIRLNGNNNELIKSLKRLKPFISHYHIVDSMGKKHDSLTAGEGKINWEKIIPALNQNASYIFECKEDDLNKVDNELKSYVYLKKIQDKLNSK